jgi:hypothetical protein
MYFKSAAFGVALRFERINKRTQREFAFSVFTEC